MTSDMGGLRRAPASGFGQDVGRDPKLLSYEGDLGGPPGRSGLIDPVMTGLRGCYSLRRRVSTAELCLRVRNDAGQDCDIGFRGDVLDVETLLLFCGKGNGAVIRWYDQSNNRNDLGLVTPSLSAKPLIVIRGIYMKKVISYIAADGLVSDRSYPPIRNGIVAVVNGNLGHNFPSGAIASHWSIVGVSTDDYMVAYSTRQNNLDPPNNYSHRIQISDPAVYLEYVGFTSSNSAALYENYRDVGYGSPSSCIAHYKFGLIQSASTQSGTTSPAGAGAKNLYLFNDGSNTHHSDASYFEFLFFDTRLTSAMVARFTELFKTPHVDYLDNHTENLWASYSLRRSLTKYRGPCMRVRRSGDSAEKDIYFDALGLVDFKDIANFVSAGNNGLVAKWYDQSGRGNDLIQTTGASQPKIFDSASGAIDRGLYFGGSHYLLTSTNSGTPSAVTFHFALSLTGETAISTSLVGLSDEYNTKKGVAAYWAPASNYFSLGVGETGTYAAARYAHTQPGGQVISCRGDRTLSPYSSMLSVWQNGIAVAVSINDSSGALPTGNYNANPWYVGGVPAGYGLYGYLENLVIYETAQSDATVELIARLIQ